MSQSIAAIVHSAFGPGAPIQVSVHGAVAGPPDAPCRLVVRDDRALAHLVRAPGELGFARAYVSGALDIEGDLYALLRARAAGAEVGLSARQRLSFLRAVGTDPWRAAPPVPPEEVDLGGRLGRHGRRRDRRAIQHHYDVGNEFYELVLGPSMVYSCAVFEEEHDTLEAAQRNKLELICRKLDLGPGMRLLDVGCGWGSLLLHAALHHGVHAVGVTISAEQVAYARARVEAAGVADRVDVRLADYRELGHERFDAISSVGMAEHVGTDRLAGYFTTLRGLLHDGGRLLNHQIGLGPDKSRAPGTRSSAVDRRSFVNRYVFPDGELQDVGELIAVMQEAGLEARHSEGLREHYALTCRAWVRNLEARWDDAVRLGGAGRARVWRLYLAGAAVNFEIGSAQVHQVLGVRTPLTGGRRGVSGLPLRLVFERTALSDAPSLGVPVASMGP